MVLEILGIVLETAAKVSGILGIIQFIQQFLPNIALENTSTAILTVDQSTNNEVANAVWGNAALHNQLIDLSTQLADGITQLSTQMGHPMQSDATIPLPPTPPPGYGGPPAGDNANAVWSFVPAGQFEQMQTKMLAAGSLAEQLREFWPVPAKDNPFFGLVFDWSNANALALPNQTPDFDITAILPADDIVSWLNRIDSQGNVWAYNAKGLAQSPGTFPESGFWQAMFTTDQFDRWKALLSTLATTATAPVWPGLAGVVLGAAVPISTGLTIVGPMDGIIVAITSTPSKNGFFQFDTDISWRNIGAVTFQSDNGQDELPQTLGFTSAVYCPKAMTSAAKCLLRSVGGVNGTVTPWTAA